MAVWRAFMSAGTNGLGVELGQAHMSLGLRGSGSGKIHRVGLFRRWRGWAHKGMGELVAASRPKAQPGQRGYWRPGRVDVRASGVAVRRRGCDVHRRGIERTKHLGSPFVQ